MRRCTFWRLLKIFTPSTWLFRSPDIFSELQYRGERKMSRKSIVQFLDGHNNGEDLRWISVNWKGDHHGTEEGGDRRQGDAGKDSVGLSTSFVLFSSVWSLPVPAVPWQRSPILNLLFGRLDTEYRVLTVRSPRQQLRRLRIFSWATSPQAQTSLYLPNLSL